MLAIDQQRIDGTLANAARLAKAIIPELNGTPLYLVQPSAGSKVTRELTGYHMGLFYPSLDLALQTQLETEGRWQGSGICVVVDAALCFATQENDCDGERKVFGTTLHELAHWLDRPEVVNPSATPYEDLVEEKKTFERREAEPSRFSPAFLSHGDSFIRLCCHLWYRAHHGGGACFGPHWLAFGNAYGGLEMLDSPMAYIHALGDELETYESLPLRKVATIAEPAEFTELWNATLHRMFVATEAAA